MKRATPKPPVTKRFAEPFTNAELATQNAITTALSRKAAALRNVEAARERVAELKALLSAAEQAQGEDELAYSCICDATRSVILHHANKI